MKKKIIITVVVILILSAAITGGIFAYKSYNQNNLVADVYSVTNLNMGYWGDQTQSYGTVTNDISQNITVDDSQTISQVYVQEGQTVAIGDKLMEYDITDKQLQLEMKKLDIQGIENDIALAQKDLADLKNTTPISNTPAVTTPATTTPATTQPETETETEVAEKTGAAYNYISKTAKAYDGDGSESKPFHFLCTQTAYVYGSYLNNLKANSYTAIFEIRKNNKKNGTLISSWTVNGAAMDKADDASKWSVLDRQQIEEETETESEAETTVDTTTTVTTETDQTGYTAAELAKKISDKEKELKDLDLDKRTAELDQGKLEKECNSGVVCATINGTVKKVGDPSNLPTDGSAFLTVSGSDGLYVTGSISEMLLGQVAAGQVVTATSWDSGMTFQATITDISKYPLDGSNYSGDGNPNASYYPFTAYIEDPTGLTNGEGVQLSMTTMDSSVATSDTLCIDKAYVREEDGKSYVLKADKDDRLVKQYITTGKTVYGQGIIITDGLSQDDRIAFPYGKTAIEGVKVSDTDSVQN